jgi:hypothetical protein
MSGMRKKRKKKRKRTRSKEVSTRRHGGHGGARRRSNEEHPSVFSVSLWFNFSVYTISPELCVLIPKNTQEGRRKAPSFSLYNALKNKAEKDEKPESFFF